LNLFMVQISSEPSYFTDVRGGTVFETAHPTYATQLSFRAATETARRLRELGYCAACVVDSYGDLPSASDLIEAKKNSLCLVTFSGRFFIQNPRGEDCGTSDRKQAAIMTQAAAHEVVVRLKRKHHRDAQVLEVSEEADLGAELAAIWPAEFATQK
jgi:hypothetical protein